MPAIGISDIGARQPPILDGDWIAEDHADLFQDVHGGPIDFVNLLTRHRLDERQIALQGGQHPRPAVGPDLAPGLASAAA